MTSHSLKTSCLILVCLYGNHIEYKIQCVTMYMLAGVQCHTTLLALSAPCGYCCHRFILYVIHCGYSHRVLPLLCTICHALSTATRVGTAIALYCCPCTVGTAMDMGTVIAYTILHSYHMCVSLYCILCTAGTATCMSTAITLYRKLYMRCGYC